MNGIDKNGADCASIRPNLKLISPYFDIAFNYRSGNYEVHYNGGFFQSTPYKDFSNETIKHIGETYLSNIRGTVLKDIDEHNFKLEQSREKEREDLSRELAKDIKNTLIKEMVV